MYFANEWGEVTVGGHDPARFSSPLVWAPVVRGLVCKAVETLLRFCLLEIAMHDKRGSFFFQQALEVG